MMRVNQFPHLAQTQNGKQLMVNGNPFLMLAAELQNSSMTNGEFMNSAWPKMVDTNINTVLGCVTWDQIEPVEGEFNFKELDECIFGARKHDIHLVLLWFGSYKNGMVLANCDFVTQG
jgi:beta-galactosidase GanA